MEDENNVLAETNEDSGHTHEKEGTASHIVQESRNSAQNSEQERFDENWDLQSPLLPSLPSQGLTERSQSLGLDELTTPVSEVTVSEVEECSDRMDPWKLSLTIISATMSMLFFGLVIGCLFFPWSDTKVRLTMDTIDSIPLDLTFPLYTDAKFRDTLNIFKLSHSWTLVVVMIISTIIAPSLLMFIQMLFISVIHQFSVEESQRTSKVGDNERSSACLTKILTKERVSKFLSLPLFLLKFSMAIVYVNAILLVATSNVRFAFGGDYSPDEEKEDVNNVEVANSDFIFAEVVSDTRGGLVAYVLGITFGVITFMIMKYHLTLVSCNERIEDPNDSPEGSTHLSEEQIDRPFSSPPPMAFQMAPKYEEFENDASQQADLNLNESGDEDFRELTSPLMSRMRNGTNIDDELEEIKDNEAQNSNCDSELPSPLSLRFVPRWCEILVFETGLLSFVLILPIAFRPLIKLQYNGILSPIFDEAVLETTSLGLSDIIIIITQKSGKGIFPVITSVLLWINVIIVPSVIWICCAIAWVESTFSRTSKHGRRFVSVARRLHPFSTMTPFALSIFVTVASLRQVSNFLFSENYFCSVAKELISADKDSQCLQISGQLQMQAFMLFTQSISTDAFISNFRVQ